MTLIRLSHAETVDYLTVTEAASALKIKPEVLRNYLCAGRLTTYKFKTLTLVSAAEVEARRRLITHPG